MCTSHAEWCGERSVVEKRSETPPAVPAGSDPVPPASVAASGPPGGYDAPVARAFFAGDVMPRPAQMGWKGMAMFRSLVDTPALPRLDLGVASNMWRDVPELPLGTLQLAPRAFEAFRQPVTAIAVPAAAKSAISAHKAVGVPFDAFKLLGTVNRRVNTRVKQRRDIDIYGRAELWRRSGIGDNAVGDCEDIAIEKRLELIAEGFPPEKLGFAVAYRSDVGLHTVLVARTDRGDFVLDSLSPYVTAWTRAAYSWVGFQSMEQPTHWYAPGARSPRS
jgi:predicted transglutaminase-like cysteine proteinase